MPDPAYQSLPFEEAIRFFRAKINVPAERWADIWREAHDKAFMVAGAMSADLIEDFRQAVDRARAQGTTLAQFRKDFDRIVATHGWSYRGSRGWRSRIIYETNLRTSYQAGRYAQLTRPAALRTHPYWRYQHSDSVTQPRPLHLSWDGLILRHDDPWWQTHFPPNGWGCKCRVFAVSRRELRRRGKSGPDRAPEDGTYEWVDKATGEVHRLPNGIDPGWDYTPGRSVLPQALEATVQKLEKLPGPLAREVAATLAGSVAFTHWFEAPYGDFPLAILPPEDVRRLRAGSQVARFSPATQEKQARRHPELRPEEYALAQQVIDQADHKQLEENATGTRSLVYLRSTPAGERGGHVLVVKATRSGAAVYVSSYRRLSRQEAERDEEVRRILGRKGK